MMANHRGKILGSASTFRIRLGAAPKSPSTLAATASRASPAQSISAYSERALRAPLNEEAPLLYGGVDPECPQ